MFKVIKKNWHFWQRLTNFWSILFFLAIIFDFIWDNCLLEFLDALAFVYIGILAVYVGNREFERWYNFHRAKHPGELFVIIWTFLIFLVLVLDVILGKVYRLPSSVISAYIAVLSILAITEKSKSLYKRRRR